MTQLTAFRGEVIYRDQDGYAEAANTPFATGSPDVIVRPRNTEEVAAALQDATRSALPVTIRSGGHSIAGLSTDDKGMVIDLTHLNEVTIVDQEQRRVRIQGGAHWGDVAATIAPHGLGITAGDTRQVGVGGLTLGGGVGWMVRRFGLAIDSLAAVEVVTADGQLIHADPDHHADLFWAVRGGGGNFGVVTGFEFIAQPVTTVYFGDMKYQPDDPAAIMEGWHRLMLAADENLTTTLNLVPPMMGNPASVLLRVCYASADTEAADRALAPFRQLAPVIEDHVTLHAYPEILENSLTLPPGFHFESRDVLARDLGPDLAKAAADLFATGRAAIVLRALGGAMARVPADATAWAHRDASALIVGGMVVPPGVPDGFLSEALAAWGKVAAHGSGTYVNFLSTITDSDVAAAYPPDTYRRLAEVKRAYDPANTFSNNFNIRP